MILQDLIILINFYCVFQIPYSLLDTDCFGILGGTRPYPIFMICFKLMDKSLGIFAAKPSGFRLMYSLKPDGNTRSKSECARPINQCNF